MLPVLLALTMLALMIQLSSCRVIHGTESSKQADHESSSRVFSHGSSSASKSFSQYPGFGARKEIRKTDFGPVYGASQQVVPVGPNPLHN
ncbi:hypothetical protein CDL15_Pgr028120 [Punica granatum]|uniref:Uncharacterized protein n=1 Tax=Punica granatum TaxID=22663 RepID=A0A218XK32_PUNGR|nr:hypothetical protein CDL15_Pgr028120 [Punica granatum]